MMASPPKSSSFPHIYPYQDDVRELTSEEIDIYHRAVRESGGFDVPSFPDNDEIGLIVPLTVSGIRSSGRKKLREGAEIALKEYNSKNGTNFELVEIEKATNQVVRGLRYYITCKIRPMDMPAEYPTTCFQAKVLCTIEGGIDIELCRIKPDESDGANCGGNDDDAADCGC